MIATSSATTKSLVPFISFDECSGLNIEGSDGVKSVFGMGGAVQSNKGDPELIVYVKFKENVNISGFKIETSMDKDKMPSLVKIFTNNISIDFSDAESLPATETIKIDSSNIGKNIPLKVAKFKSVSYLTVKFDVKIKL
jgi:hypothetical protein